MTAEQQDPPAQPRRPMDLPPSDAEMSNDRYLVIRPGPDLPIGFLGDLNGRWYEVDAIPEPLLGDKVQHPSASLRHAYPTRRIETRDDGQRARVWEVRL